MSPLKIAFMVLAGYTGYQLGAGTRKLPIVVKDSMEVVPGDPLAAIWEMSGFEPVERFALIHISTVTGEEGCFVVEGAEDWTDVVGYFEQIRSQQLAAIEVPCDVESFDEVVAHVEAMVAAMMAEGDPTVMPPEDSETDGPMEGYVRRRWGR